MKKRIKLKSFNIFIIFICICFLLECGDDKNSGGGDSEGPNSYLAKQIRREYKLPEMKQEKSGFVQSWVYENSKMGYKVAIDNNKNLRLQKLGK